MKKNILITGGAGFIGSNLALKLLERGYNVSVLDIHYLTHKATNHPLHLHFKSLKSDEELLKAWIVGIPAHCHPGWAVRFVKRKKKEESWLVSIIIKAVTYWLHYVLQNENEIRQYE